MSDDPLDQEIDFSKGVHGNPDEFERALDEIPDVEPEDHDRL